MLPELQDKQSMVLSGGYEDDEDHGEWFSTEEMGEEIQVATSDQIRINRSPISINHCTFDYKILVSCVEAMPLIW
ncbi:E3 ubiquitin-protein ligase ORTHRUS 3-like [Solanum dulcamara]|uniref:E3 ubiquitin-protein ligase ORTHRUS 3-like n=1 Tax=Solanum dulcamara TaxID=45834 RepID=UPI0024865BF4|nr:E3 ubiquitin-protein ligase ORTHRUS 3-like [Solanum dulcamara]